MISRWPAVRGTASDAGCGIAFVAPLVQVVGYKFVVQFRIPRFHHGSVLYSAPAAPKA